MANWDKLNFEFDKVLSEMTSDDWNAWALNREAKKAMRQMEMMLKRKLKEDSIFLSEIKGSQSQIEESLFSKQFTEIFFSYSSAEKCLFVDNKSFAIAA